MVRRTRRTWRRGIDEALRVPFPAPPPNGVLVPQGTVLRTELPLWRMMRDNQLARRGSVRELVHGDSYMSEIDTTKATAHLPGLDIDIVHRQSPNGDWEQMSINLRATPSFEALGRSFEAIDPFTLWVQAARLMWMPWLLTAQTMMPPDGRPRALASVRPQPAAPAPGG
jgi:hypothetical protein